MGILHRLELLVPPSLTTVPATGRATALEGTNTSLGCLAAGRPRPTVSWKRGGVAVGGTGEWLHLLNLTPAMAGLYECRASNGLGGQCGGAVVLEVDCKYSTVPPAVLYSTAADAPRVRAGRATVYTGLGRALQLSCRVDARPIASVIWLRHNRPVTALPGLATTTSDQTHTLHISSVSGADFGEFICQATNRVATASSNIVVVGRNTRPVRAVSLTSIS